MNPRRNRHNWPALLTQFMAAEHDSFRSFLSDLGYPEHLARSPRAHGIAELKRSIIAKIIERERQTTLADAIRQRERTKLETLQQLEESARALRATVMSRLIPDLRLTGKSPGETDEQWSTRFFSEQVQSQSLTPAEIVALATALKIADELLRKATGLEEFDWDSFERRSEASKKGSRLEFEIVKTSGAKDLSELNFAPEMRKNGTERPA